MAPLPFSQIPLMANDSVITVGINSNIETNLQIMLQFINGSYFSNISHFESIIKTDTVSYTPSQTHLKGFL